MLLIIDNYNHFTCVLASSAALELPTAKLPRLHSSPCWAEVPLQIRGRWSCCPLEYLNLATWWLHSPKRKKANPVELA